MAKCRQLLEESLAAESPRSETRVLELVKTAPTVKPGDRLAQAAALMVQHSVQAVAVVNQASKLLGVLSEDEILSAALAGLQDEPRPKLATTR